MEQKLYESSSGEKKVISEMHTAYLINAINKKQVSIWEDGLFIEEIEERIEMYNLLEAELKKRHEDFLNDWKETIKEHEGDE